VRYRNAIIWGAALLAMALTARLGFWQLDRAAQKLALQEARQQQARAAPLDVTALPRTAAAARAAEHRTVHVHGRWLPASTVFLDNRPMAGRVGFYVLTPLALAGGSEVLLVQRGFWPRDARERTRVDAPAPPQGVVEVQGRLALTPSRLYELAADAGGPIRQNLDLEAFAREARLPLLPWVLVQQEGAAAAGDGLQRQWPEPASDVHKHYGYAAQWFALAALVLTLLLWFQVLRHWRRRRTK
jgi:surfeit locus 1 family protein